MGKKQFCFFQTAETGNRTPDSGVKGSGANHYPRAPAQLLRRESLIKITPKNVSLSAVKIVITYLITAPPVGHFWTSPVCRYNLLHFVKAGVAPDAVVVWNLVLLNNSYKHSVYRSTNPGAEVSYNAEIFVYEPWRTEFYSI